MTRQKKVLLFSHEKLFRTEQRYNTENNIVYSAIFENTLETIRTIKCFQKKKKYVKVCAAVSKKGKLPLKFIDKGLKANAEYFKQY